MSPVPTRAQYTVDGESIDVASIAERLGVKAACAYGRLKRVQARGELTWSALGLGAPPSRQRRMLTFIVELDRDVTLDDVVDGISATDTELDRTRLAALVSAHLHQLVVAGKLMRYGERGRFKYRATRKALVDGRGRSRPERAPKPTKAPKPKVEKPAPKPKPAPIQPIATPKPLGRLLRALVPIPAAPPQPAAKPAPFVVPNAALTPPRLGQLGSEAIAAHIAAFEARGGRIQKLKPGESSYSIRAQQEAFLDTRGRGYARPKASASEAVKRNRADNDDTLDADDLVDVA